MTDIQAFLQQAFSAAIERALGTGFAGTDPVVRCANDSTHGDWQANFAMSLAKRAGRPPRAIAEAVVAAVELGGIASSVEVAGPGFVNIRLTDAFLETMMAELVADQRCGVSIAAHRDIVAIDYSAPNVAKEMHVGHIRSTIIGDALSRVLEFLGHQVLRRNHLGDWGTQFGMLIEHVVELGKTSGQHHDIGDLNALYRESKARFDLDPDFAERARHRVVALQAGEPDTVGFWKQLIVESKKHFGKIYAQLGVRLADEDYFGESFYNSMLAPVMDELVAAGVAVESEGAVCVFPPGFKGRDGEPVPLIVRKGDGGYGYDATDLAALRHRIHDLKATRLIYVVGAPQKQHFDMIFAAGKMAGWLKDGISAEHVPFGSILGEDGKPFKTRAGDNVKLTDLIDEALRRARTIVTEKSPSLAETEKDGIASAIGIGAIKYVDLCNDRIKDYVFSWDRMLAFEGNTAPYLQNAYVRIQGIFRKAAEAGVSIGAAAIRLGTAEERALAMQMLKLGDVLDQVSRSLEPHRLCTWLYDLASIFHGFYEKCPVMNAENAAIKASRLALCREVGRCLQLGLSLLGIATIDQM
ncbi:MAG: arginine--tRNA ligase [Spirochaetes bacterium GWD1_61_31]|nr:MAG: arginine--tRNA ligase [Spirochaetes bacterium GWB1_60_80]OHD41419.1 MAG: arginine--tRNA ligase [Spirochaetes bacterium GWD1_61_31]OHD45202.1 MAG: arginine--tRNA ligase [Spirochaetes bacterium GWE1_60_18]OHD60703.1 MAG: arginine--tRNA ligase [Spirochaetes bacterium GWF1_60_12]